MYKGIVLLKRAPGQSQEDFRAWFMGEHLEHSRNQPAVRRYTGSFIVGPGPASPWENGEGAFDIISEIWCDDREALEATFKSLYNRGGVQDSLDNCGVRIALIAEETVIFDRQQEAGS